MNSQAFSERKIELLIAHEVLSRTSKYNNYRDRVQVCENLKKRISNVSDDKKTEIEPLLNETNKEYEEGLIYCSKFETWKVTWAASLSIGINPYTVEEFMGKYKSKLGEPFEKPTYDTCIKEFYGSKIYQEFQKSLKLFSNKFGKDESQHKSVEFIEWAEKINIPFSKELTQIVWELSNVLGDKEEIERLRLENQSLENTLEKNNQKQEMASGLSKQVKKLQEMLASLINHHHKKGDKPNFSNVISAMSFGGNSSVTLKTVRKHYKIGNERLMSESEK